MVARYGPGVILLSMIFTSTVRSASTDPLALCTAARPRVTHSLPVYYAPLPCSGHRCSVAHCLSVYPVPVQSCPVHLCLLRSPAQSGWLTARCTPHCPCAARPPALRPHHHCTPRSPCTPPPPTPALPAPRSPLRLRPPPPVSRYPPSTSCVEPEPNLNLGEQGETVL